MFKNFSFKWPPNQRGLGKRIYWCPNMSNITIKFLMFSFSWEKLGHKGGEKFWEWFSCIISIHKSLTLFIMTNVQVSYLLYGLLVKSLMKNQLISWLMLGSEVIVWEDVRHVSHLSHGTQDVIQLYILHISNWISYNSQTRYSFIFLTWIFSFC